MTPLATLIQRRDCHNLGLWGMKTSIYNSKFQPGVILNFREHLAMTGNGFGCQ